MFDKSGAHLQHVIVTQWLSNFCTTVRLQAWNVRWAVKSLELTCAYPPVLRHKGPASLVDCQRTNDVCCIEFLNTFNTTISCFKYIHTKSLKPGPACIANSFILNLRGASLRLFRYPQPELGYALVGPVRSTVWTSTGRIADSNLRKLNNHITIPVTVV